MRVNGKYRLEHIVIWEAANGPIPDKWVIHHLNGTKDDNRLENLVAMPRSHHGPRAHIDPSDYEARIRELENRAAGMPPCREA
ncbi:MAG: HNH endonuclease [Chloroflexi bacterium]|nr:HNH endonuclease [Chloroflexota bacterium]